MMSERIAVGVDLGGTKIVAGLVTDSGRIMAKPVKVATNAQDPAEEIMKRMIGAINKTLDEAGLTVDKIAGIGIGSPGPLDLKKGIILNTGNLPTLNNYKIKSRIKKEFSLPVKVNNDANCFALGEACFGAVMRIKLAVGVTLGTGFGCGLIINGRIYDGATGTAAEIDMCPYLEGNLEDYISGRGVEKIYQSLSGKSSTPKEIEDLARHNDPVARETWQCFGTHLGVALSYVVNLFDPDTIMVGGSLSNAFDLFFTATMETLNQNVNPIPSANVKVVKAKLGSNAGFIGAACLFF